MIDEVDALAATKEYLNTEFPAWGQQPEVVPERDLLTYTDGVMDNYICVWIEEPFASVRDRSINEDEESQPIVTLLRVSCVSVDPDAALNMSRAIRKKLNGWEPSEEADSYFHRIGTGGFTYVVKDKSPLRYIREASYKITLNI